MRKNILQGLGIFTFVCLFAFVSCKDDEVVAGAMDFVEASKTVSYKAEVVEVEVLSNMGWRIGIINSDWIKPETKKGSGNQTVVINCDENLSVNTRSEEIYFVTDDGKGYKKFILNQQSSEPSIVLDQLKMEVDYRSRIHIVGLISNISPDNLDITVDYESDTETNWIINPKVDGDQLKFNIGVNQGNKNREATILVSYSHSGLEDEAIWVSLVVKQLSRENQGPPEEKDFDYVRGLPQGVIEENISIRGNVVANGQSDNFMPNIYIIQNSLNKTVVFESAEPLGLGRYDKVHVSLDGTEMSNNTEIGYTYHVIKGISSGNILEQTPDPGFSVGEMYMKDLTDDHLMSMVTLKDVEFSIPFGGFTNFNEGYLSKSPAHLRTHPSSIRDINGNSMYMLTNSSVAYRRETLPKGSGKITGVIIREIGNYYGAMGPYSIRHLSRSDIDLDHDRSNGFTNVLVEWHCEKPVGMTEGQLPFLYPTTGSTSTSLTKNNATGLYSSWGATHIYFGTKLKYRGDEPSGWKDKEVILAGLWDTETYWLIKDISTTGISTHLSLQIEANSASQSGPVLYAVEYAFDENGPWTYVDEYVCRALIDGNNIDDTVMPGFKVYNISLPDELQNQNRAFIRLRLASMVRIDGQMAGVNGLGFGTNRLAHVSIKYNK